MFGSSRLEDEDRQKDLDLFKSCVKIDSVDMLKFTHAQVNMLGFRFNRSLVFGLTSFGFHVRNIDILITCILDSIHIQYASNLFQYHVFVSFEKIGFPFQSLGFGKYRVWFKA